MPETGLKSPKKPKNETKAKIKSKIKKEYQDWLI